jgi:hypothetical protein
VKLVEGTAGRDGGEGGLPCRSVASITATFAAAAHVFAPAADRTAAPSAASVPFAASSEVTTCSCACTGGPIKERVREERGVPACGRGGDVYASAQPACGVHHEEVVDEVGGVGGDALRHVEEAGLENKKRGGQGEERGVERHVSKLRSPAPA